MINVTIIPTEETRVQIQSLRGPQGIPGPQGPRGEKGEDGSIKFDELTPEQMEVLRGPAGKNGENGVSPITSFERIDGGYRLTIKDAAGTHSVEIMDGVGVQGPAGPQGPEGPAGPAGSDAAVTATNIQAALGYKPASEASVNQLSEKMGDKLDASALTTAVNDALAQAKESGEFDGTDGVGIKSVVQTTTSSADGGSNVVTVTKTDGTTSTFTVKNGSKGSTGEPGKTPVKGTDYFTEADKTEMVNAVIAALPDASEVSY